LGRPGGSFLAKFNRRDAGESDRHPTHTHHTTPPFPPAQLDKVSSKKSKDAQGREGTHFDIPLSLSGMRKGADKGGAAAAIWDFVVHPDTVAMAAANAAIKNMLVETAMERIEAAATVKLSRRARTRVFDPPFFPLLRRALCWGAGAGRAARIAAC